MKSFTWVEWCLLKWKFLSSLVSASWSTYLDLLSIRIGSICGRDSRCIVNRRRCRLLCICLPVGSCSDWSLFIFFHALSDLIDEWNIRHLYCRIDQKKFSSIVMYHWLSLEHDHWVITWLVATLVVASCSSTCGSGGNSARVSSIRIIWTVTCGLKLFSCISICFNLL